MPTSPRPVINSLGWWLAAIHVLIVLVVALGMSWLAVRLLGRLADSQQSAAVQLAGADARGELTRIGEDALTFSRVLSERPTLRRLLLERDLAGLQPFLERFCGTAGVNACAVYEGEQRLAAAGEPMPWESLLIVAAEQGERFLTAPPGPGPAVLGAVASMEGADPAIRVVVADVLDERFATRLMQQPGFTIRLHNFRDFDATATADGRLDGRYVASHPVFSSTGEGVVVIETSASSAEVDQELANLKWQLLGVASVLAAFALLAGILLGRRVTKPAEALISAAHRLGQGDFATAIPLGGPAEIGQLARTMDDMRRNLIGLTSTLRAREAEAQAVLGGIVEGVYAVDEERRITYMNDTAAKLLGIEPASAVGRFCGDVLKPLCAGDEKPCDSRCPIVAARTGAATGAVEYLQTPAGNRRMVLSSAAPVDGLQVQVLRDETELEAVRRARDTVFANISHEFRTPLAAQLASIELLRDGLGTRTPAQLEELVLSLERGTLRLTRLIDNLLESVRIESGQLDIRKQSIDLGDVVEDAIALVESLLRQRGQLIDRQMTGELAMQGDAVRLTQVFVNLLANASKFAPPATTIRIHGHREQGRIVIAVEDAGPGVPEGASQNVFERFSRGGVEPAPGGMGLGLAISRSIVQRHGGGIEVSRTAEGWTRFTITL